MGTSFRDSFSFPFYGHYNVLPLGFDFGEYMWEQDMWPDLTDDAKHIQPRD